MNGFRAWLVYIFPSREKRPTSWKPAHFVIGSFLLRLPFDVGSQGTVKGRAMM